MTSRKELREEYTYQELQTLAILHGIPAVQTRYQLETELKKRNIV